MAHRSGQFILRPFHVTIHGRPVGLKPIRQVQWGQSPLPVLPASPAQCQPLQVRFEQACSALADLPRMVVEPDGSFVWVSSDPLLLWQLDGVLHDQGPQLSHVEAKGTCDNHCFDRFLDALGEPRSRLMFQILSSGVFLDNATFRAFAFGPQDSRRGA